MATILIAGSGSWNEVQPTALFHCTWDDRPTEGRDPGSNDNRMAICFTSSLRLPLVVTSARRRDRTPASSSFVLVMDRLLDCMCLADRCQQQRAQASSSTLPCAHEWGCYMRAILGLVYCIVHVASSPGVYSLPSQGVPQI